MEIYVIIILFSSHLFPSCSPLFSFDIPFFWYFLAFVRRIDNNLIFDVLLISFSPLFRPAPLPIFLNRRWKTIERTMVDEPIELAIRWKHETIVFGQSEYALCFGFIRCHFNFFFHTAHESGWHIRQNSKCCYRILNPPKRHISNRIIALQTSNKYGLNWLSDVWRTYCQWVWLLPCSESLAFQCIVLTLDDLLTLYSGNIWF